MFNEMTPASDDANYLKASSKAVIDAMIAADSDAIWMMQGWLFYAHARFWQRSAVRAYLSGVPDSRMIILDLVAEDFPVWRRYDAFFGKPFIWCMLHNFGDVRGLYGNLTHIASAAILQRKEAEAMVNLNFF